MSETLHFEQKFEAIRRRLVAIRKLVTDDNQSEFARKLDMHPNRWNNIERGSGLTLRVAFLISKEFNLPIEYILEGHTARLSATKKRQLAELERSLNK